jgi:2-iminobutanoate/2-iminopropanoate deaminase
MTTDHPPYSPVRVSGDIVATAGQVAFDGNGLVVAGGIHEQTRQALGNLERRLGEAGCSLHDVFKVTAFIADIADVPAYNDIYREFFQPPYPARTTVQAGLPEGLLIEIEAIARVPTD